MDQYSSSSSSVRAVVWVAEARPYPRYLVFAAAMVAMVLFGIVGIGRAGSGAFDMAFLYAAGRTWLDGLDAYVLANRTAAVGSLAFDVYAVAYPPQVFPLAALLGAFSFDGAVVAMLALNLASVAALAAYCMRVAVTDSAGEGRAAMGQWLMPAVVIGNPFTAHVLWMGQTTLIVAAALVWGVAFAKQNRWFVSGLLLGISTIKPQFSVLVLVWLMLQRRWWVVGASAAFALAFAAVPLAIAGPRATLVSWLADVARYQGSEFNLAGFQHSFGLRSVFFHLGLDLSTAMLAIPALLATAYVARAKLVQRDVLPLLLCCALLLTVAHDYDLVLAVPVMAALARHLHGGREGRGGRASWSLGVGLVALLLMFTPQRIVRPLELPMLSQFRVFVLLGLVVWLLVLSRRQARVAQAGQGLAAPSTIPGP